MEKRVDPGLVSTAKALMENGECRESESVLRNLIADYPDNAEIASLLGDCGSRVSDFAKAEFWYRRAISLQPYNPDYSRRYNRFRIDNFQQLPQDRPKYLVGPLMSAAYFFGAFADCVFFGRRLSPDKHRSEIETSPYMDIDNILSRCPKGFTPDRIICLIPEYYAPPLGIEKCGIESIGIYTDLPAHSEMIALSSPLLDVSLTQGYSSGPGTLLELGAHKSGTGFFIGDDPLFWRDKNKQRDIDILFLSTFSLPHIYKGRNELIHKILPLAEKYKVVIGTEDQNNSAELSSRAKIIINASHSGELTSEMIARRIFESQSCGALCFAEDDIEVVKRFYKDKLEIIYYNPDNITALIESYLKSDEERQRIAEAGKRKTISKYSYASNIKAISYLIEAENGYRSSSVKHRLPRAEVLLRRARMLIHSHYPKDWLEITSLLEKALDQDPDMESVVLNDLGVICAYQGEYAKADRYFQDALGKGENHPIFTANAFVNQLYLLKDFDKIREPQEFETENFLDDAAGILPLYLVCDSNGVLPPEKMTSSIYYLKLQEAILRNLDRKKGFKKNISSITLAEINKGIGWAYYQKEEYGNAVRFYEQSLREYDDDYEIYYQLFLAYMKIGDNGRALENIEKALSLQPLNIRYRASYYALLFRLERHDEIFKSADLILKAQLRIPESIKPIYYYRAVSTEKINHPKADEMINDFIAMEELSDEEKSYFDNTAMAMLGRWKSAVKK